MIRVTVWNENIHEKEDPKVCELYPGGLHGYIASFLADPDIRVRTATLDMPENGLPDKVLADTDVLLWWGHVGHERVDERTVEQVCQRVWGGMGLIVLHSGHHSGIFKRLLGTSCNLKWRDGARERIWTIKPGHPIAAGIDESFVIEQEEMYGEPFDIPNPEDVIFLGWFNGGEVIRSGCTWSRGKGRIFYFQPGHETNPAFRNPSVQRIIKNAVKWAYNDAENAAVPCVWAEAKENI